MPRASVSSALKTSRSNTTLRQASQIVVYAGGLGGQIDEIEGLDRAAYLDHWRCAFGCPPPKYHSLVFMKRALIWELQNRALGGVSTKTARRLKQIAHGKSVPTTAKPGVRHQMKWDNLRSELRE